MTPLDLIMSEAGCLARGCQVHIVYDVERVAWIVQHGKNPESRIELPKKSRAHCAAAAGD